MIVHLHVDGSDFKPGLRLNLSGLNVNVLISCKVGVRLCDGFV